jgi:hypothetical protein
VVLWEIDGDPSGGAFHSQVRAARDWGEAALDDELALPEGSSSGKIAVRVLDSIGDVGVATS